MTLAETRQLGIEFERRVQTMIPETEFVAKLDTDTIYSFLNQYQDKYIHEIYVNLDSIQTGSKSSARIETVLQNMLTSFEADANSAQDNNSDLSTFTPDTSRSLTFTLPKDFQLYLRSVSKVSSTYKYKINTISENETVSIVPNTYVAQGDVWKLIETTNNDLRILRYPIAVFDKYNTGNPTITVIYDRYTTIEGIKVLYYKQPQHFDLMTSTPCELPMDTFDDLVTGAINLYIEYVAGAEAKKKQNAKQQSRQNKQNNETEE